MAREVRLPSGTEYLSVVEAAVHIATNLHPFTPYSEAPADVIARIRYKATFEAMRDKMVRMIKNQQLRTIDKLTLLTKEYQPSGLLMELDLTFDKLEDMKISLSQFIDICKDEQLSVFVDPNYHLIPPEPTPEPYSPLEPDKVSDKTEPELGRRDSQIDKICKTAKSLEYDLLAIPEGGKAKIKAECLKDSSLFTDSAFDHAWKKASKDKIISIRDKEKYL